MLRRCVALGCRASRAAASAQPARLPSFWTPLSTLSPEPVAAKEEWYKEHVTVPKLSEEITARWVSAPVPGRGSLVHLLKLVGSREDALAALDACKQFHLARAHAGWLTGLGNEVSSLVAQACCAHGEWRAALDAFLTAPKMGLRHTASVHHTLLTAAAREGGPDGVLHAYRALRATGEMRVTPEVARLVMRGLQGWPGGSRETAADKAGTAPSPRRAFDAGMAFVREGIPVNRRTWLSLMCAAASAPDVEVVKQCMPLACPPGVAPSPLAHLAAGLMAALHGDAEAARAGVAQAAALVAPGGGGDVTGPEGVERMQAVMAAWAQQLPAGLTVPGGADGLLQRLREAGTGGLVVGETLEAVLNAKGFTDGQLPSSASD